jgi:MFS family permease
VWDAASSGAGGSVRAWVYSLATLGSAFLWNFLLFIALRCVTGIGIGAECAATNWAVDELIPETVRGMVDL